MFGPIRLSENHQDVGQTSLLTSSAVEVVEFNMKSYEIQTKIINVVPRDQKSTISQWLIAWYLGLQSLHCYQILTWQKAEELVMCHMLSTQLWPHLVLSPRSLSDQNLNLASVWDNIKFWFLNWFLWKCLSKKWGPNHLLVRNLEFDVKFLKVQMCCDETEAWQDWHRPTVSVWVSLGGKFCLSQRRAGRYSIQTCHTCTHEQAKHLTGHLPPGTGAGDCAWR